MSAHGSPRQARGDASFPRPDAAAASATRRQDALIRVLLREDDDA